MKLNSNILRLTLAGCFGFALILGFIDEAKATGAIAGEASNTMIQQRTITGTVVDESGIPLVGVTVQENGTTNGVITDINGKYSIKVHGENPGLKFSYIGFDVATVTVGTQSTIGITMKASVAELEEAVVIGYGTAKKRDLVGAIDNVTSKAFEERSNANITRSLQGQIPSLNITMSDGKPSSGATYNVRGTTSIGSGGSALILIDGVEGDPNTINPQDVESVSVLKDASSAAVYGARGAFGVVLITTKKASKGKVSVNYDGNMSFYTRTVKPSFVTNGYEWTTSFLDSFRGNNDYTSDPTSINNIFPFSRAWYDELKRRNDNPDLPKVRVNGNGEYEYFGNTDWNSLLYKDWTHGTEHKLSVNGGTEKSSFYVSGRYFSQDGIYRYNSDDMERLTLRANGKVEISPKWSVENNFSIDNTNYSYPLISYGDVSIQRNLQHQGYPVAMLYNPDGTYTYSSIYNGVGDFNNETSGQTDNTLTVRNTLAAAFMPIKDVLTFKGDFSYNYKDYERIRTNRYAPYSTGPGIYSEKGQSLRRMWNQETNYLAGNFTANFAPKLGDNHIASLLVGANIEQSEQRRIYNKRDNYLYPDKPNFVLMDGTTFAIEERSTDWAYVGLFYRMNYSYKSRYLAEVSGRYDGSSKFPENERWGLFPSASVAWRISEEAFMKSTRNVIDNLKLRFSVGTLGNGNVSPYSFSELMTVSKTTTLLNGAYQTQTSLPTLIPNNLTWEKVTTYDVGLDLDMFRGRFSIGADIYRRNTSDMYVNGEDLPQVFGASSPKGNYADLRTDGWEVSVGWKDRVKVAGNDLSYNFKFMLWDSRSEITKYAGNENKLLSNYYEGMEIGEIWGYLVDGLFTSAEEIANHADQSKLKVSSSNILLPGDLKFRDVNGDGVVYQGSNTLNDQGDLVKVGNSSARYQFGFNVGVNYCGLGVNAFFQGVGKKDWYPSSGAAYFWGQYDRPYTGYYPTDQVGNMWIEGVNEDASAYWPRLRGYLSSNSSRALTYANNRYLQNAAYLRLKSLTIDYTLPNLLTSKIGVSSVKFYVSGENLWTITGLTKHTTNFDPEVIGTDSDITTSSDEGDGYSYPMLKSFTIGVKVAF